MDFWIDFFGWGNAILFSIVAFPQIVRTLKTKNLNGVSVGVYWLLVIANIDAFIYAYLITEIPLLTKYAFGFLTGVIYLIIYYKVKIKSDNITIKSTN